MNQIADFTLLRELGRGGMGVVYEALEQPLQRRVALKLLNPTLLAETAATRRFLQEARHIAQLSHPAIIKVYRYGYAAEQPYLALEYIAGQPLDNVLAQEKLSLTATLDILQTVAAALGHAHQQGIVHRDVKPGNIFRHDDGRTFLGDFGLAKDLAPDVRSLTDSGLVVGTPAYMSPEQAMGERPTPATDVYALGVVAFEMLSGRVPFTADTVLAMLLQHLNAPPPPLLDLVPPSVPAALIALVERMLEKTPAQRPADGQTVAQLLAAVPRFSLAAAPTLRTGVPTQAQAASTLVSEPPASHLEELEMTVACFKWLNFAKDTCQELLPARVAFLLESWYRLVRHAVHAQGGVIDRYVGGKITALFGYPQRYNDHTQRAFQAARALQKALRDFNRTHDLELRMSAGIACGPALAGRIAGDNCRTSVQGDLMGEMNAMATSKELTPALRLNRAAYRRVAAEGNFHCTEIMRTRRTLQVWLAE